MSAVVIAGDTSGSVTLQAPAVAGTTTLTLPNSSGTLMATGGALGTPTSGNLANCTFPTLNQNTTGNAATATTATNLTGGSNGTVPYQTGSGATAMLAVGSSGQVLTSNGVAAPSWTTISTSPPTSYLAVGTYVIAFWVLAQHTAYQPPGTIVAGSSINYNNDGSFQIIALNTLVNNNPNWGYMYAYNSGWGTLPGTWRAMTGARNDYYDSTYGCLTLFVRTA